MNRNDSSGKMINESIERVYLIDNSMRHKCLSGYTCYLIKSQLETVLFNTAFITVLAAEAEIRQIRDQINGQIS